MAVIGKKRKKSTPEVSTASLPDIIFTLLFFFMVSAKVKDSTLIVEHTMPSALEAKKLTGDDKVSTIHIGKPLPQYEKIYGEEPRIQLDSSIKDPADIKEWVIRSRTALKYDTRQNFLVNIKSDGKVPYKLVDEVKIELRKSEFGRNVNYDATSLDYGE